MIAKIKDPKEFNELVFFVSITGIVSAISKTMVFVDNFDKRIILANHLYNLLLAYKKDRETLIQIFNLILKLNIKVQYLKDFHNIDIKI